MGPYSPGVIADGYLYVSGQGAKAADGQMPATFEAQAQQALDNVKAVVEAAGLTLDHVVYTHVYLEDIDNAAALDRVYARYFPKDPPARAMIGVARLPGTPVEINAVAVVDLDGRTPVRLPGWDSGTAVFAGNPRPAIGCSSRRCRIAPRTAGLRLTRAPRWTPRSTASRP